jgi:hypothetical protein
MQPSTFASVAFNLASEAAVEPPKELENCCRNVHDFVL